MNKIDSTVTRSTPDTMSKATKDASWDQSDLSAFPYLAFALNGDASFGYPYTKADEALIINSFNRLTAISNIHCDNDANDDVNTSNIVPLMLADTLVNVCHVDSRDSMDINDDNDEFNIFSSCDFDKIISVTLYKTFEKNEKNSKYNAYYHRFICEKHDDSYGDSYGVMFRYNDDSSNDKKPIIMNFDVASSLAALRTLNDYGIEDIVILDLFVHSMNHPGITTFVSDSESYYRFIRSMVLARDHSTLDFLFDFVHHVVLMNQDLVLPDYTSVSKKHVPIPIIDANIDAGDFDSPYRTRLKDLFDRIDDDNNKTRRDIVNEFVAPYRTGSTVAAPAETNDYRSNIGLIKEMYCDDYDDNWNLLNSAIKPTIGKLRNGFVFNLFLWCDALFYSYSYKLGTLYKIITNTAESRRFSSLFASREQLLKLWQLNNGYGVGWDDAFTFGHTHTVEVLPCSGNIPRRYWDAYGKEHDLSKYIVVLDYFPVDSPSVLPNEIINYIRDGIKPSELTFNSLWNAYNYEYDKQDAVYNITNDSTFYDNVFPQDVKHMTFKLLTKEYESEWEQWASMLA